MTGARLKLAMLIAVLSFASEQSAANVKQDVANRKFMHDYARCVVKAKHARAAEAIVANVGNGTILNRYSDLINGECLADVAGSAQMSFAGDLYRYALADALVNADYAVRGEADFSNRLPLAHLLPPDKAELDATLAATKSKRKRDELEQEFNNRTGIVWLSRYGECVVRQNPVKARLWLLTPPGIPEETSRIGDLQPAFNACISEGTLKFNRVTMRGTVAVNYYRLAMATPQPVAGKTK